MLPTPKLLAAWITYRAWAAVSAAADLVSERRSYVETGSYTPDEENRL